MPLKHPMAALCGWTDDDDDTTLSRLVRFIVAYCGLYSLFVVLSPAAAAAAWGYYSLQIGLDWIGWLVGWLADRGH